MKKVTKKFLFFFGILVVLLSVRYALSLCLIKNKNTPVIHPAIFPGTVQYISSSGSVAKFRYPIIVNYPNKTIMDKVNKFLVDAYGSSGCGEDSPKENSYWDMLISVDYSKNDIFSVNQGGSYFCNAAYPTNNYSETLTFDMKTGEQIGFEKLFKNYDADKEKILRTIYGDIIAKTEEFTAKNPDAEGVCENVNTFDTIAEAGSPDYRISSSTRELIVTVGYPHVMEACNPEATVPVEKLLPFVADTSILKRI